MGLREPFYRLGEQFAIELPGARAVFTTRRGGVSRGPYASLNLGWRSGDDADSVAYNHGALEGELGLRLAFVKQVHGSHVREVTAQAAAGDSSAHAPPRLEADGQVTSSTEVAPAVLTADCLPIVVAGGGGVAVLHGGWRGLHAGVVAAGVRALHDRGAQGPLSAAIGPGAGPCCYEVGSEVHEAFAGLPSVVRHGSYLDLKAIAAFELKRAGVGQVHDIGLCTICSDPALLFSHRRDRGITGRQAGVAWLV